MQVYESGDERGLAYGYVLSGRGGGRRVGRNQIAVLDLLSGESLWPHWDRGIPEARAWLRDSAGLSEFACGLLLEEVTRPRLPDLGTRSLPMFLRGVNLDPDAKSEDMVSLRVFVDARRMISLRLRPLKVVVDLFENPEAGRRPKMASEIVYYPAYYLTDRVDTLISGTIDQLGAVEELVEANECASPDQHQLHTLRHRLAGLRRYLAPQRDIYLQLARYKLSWSIEDDAGYRNELNNRPTWNPEELGLIREHISVLQEVRPWRVTERMNRTMYLLGIIAGFFLPMSFVTGLPGVGIGGISGADIPHGFWLACLLIGGVTAFQWWVFRQLRWLWRDLG